jgi:fatty acid/phospholipid biosynthesis enzyme
VCIISHGSSNATAIMNALRVADTMVRSGVVEATKFAIRPDQEG